MGTAPSPQAQQAAVDTSIEQQQLNNFLGPVEGAFGGLPVAERNSEYYIRFKGMAGTNPELINCTSFGIEALIDPNGGEFTPAEGNVAFFNLLQNFEIGKNAIIIPDIASSQNQGLGGVHSIKGIGSINPILYNQTGSSVSASVNEILFQDGVDSLVADEAILDFRGNINKNNSTSITTTPTTVTNYTSQYLIPDSGVAEFNLTNGTYTLDSTNVGNIQSITFNISYNLSYEDITIILGNTPTVEIKVELLREGTSIADKITTLEVGTINEAFSFQETDFTTYTDAEYKIRISYTEAQWVYNPTVELTSIQFQVSNQVPFASSTSVPIDQHPMWSQGNSISNYWITASGYLSANYGLTPSFIQKCEDFGFSPITSNFNLRAGDKIRFGYNPNNEYVIYEVIEPDAASDGLLKFKLNTYVPTSVYLDNFVIFRINENNPENIILDVPNINIQNNLSFTGVIVPEYISDRLQNQLNSRTVPADESRQ